MIADGDNNCELDEEKLIPSCSDASLFLCSDKSRCLPNKFKCDGVQNCIDGSDEIKQCEYPTMIRLYKPGEQILMEHWLQFLQVNHKLKSLLFFDAKEIFTKERLLAKEREKLKHLKCS